jgi:hypothetical protein
LRESLNDCLPSTTSGTTVGNKSNLWAVGEKAALEIWSPWGFLSSFDLITRQEQIKGNNMSKKRGQWAALLDGC